MTSQRYMNSDAHSSGSGHSRPIESTVDEMNVSERHHKLKGHCQNLPYSSKRIGETERYRRMHHHGGNEIDCQGRIGWSISEQQIGFEQMARMVRCINGCRPVRCKHSNAYKFEDGISIRPVSFLKILCKHVSTGKQHDDRDYLSYGFHSHSVSHPVGNSKPGGIA